MYLNLLKDAFENLLLLNYKEHIVEIKLKLKIYNYNKPSILDLSSAMQWKKKLQLSKKLIKIII